ncbi:MAG: MFS transporter [Hyphomicrobiaceae bacterium]
MHDRQHHQPEFDVTAAVNTQEAAQPARRTFVLLALAAFASSINLRVCDPLLPQIANGFSVSVGQAAAIITAFAVGYGSLQLFFGPVGDRFGKYRIAALASLATGIVTALAAATSTLGQLTAIRFLAGACAAAPIPLAFAWIGDAVPFDKRQAVLARFLSAQISGIVLGQAAGGLLGEHLGWRAVFILVGACHLTAGIAMLLELKFHPEGQPRSAIRRTGPGDVLAAVVGLLQRPWVRVMLISVFIEGFAFYGAFAYIGADLHQRFDLSYALIGVTMAVFGLGAITYALTARRLLGLIGERGLALAGGAVLCVAYFCLALAPSAIAVAPIMVALGLGFYMIHNTLQTNATQMAPESRGLGVSMFALALFIGQSVGVYLAAPAVDRWHAPAIYLVAAIVLPAIALWFRAMLAKRPAPGP